MVKRISSLQLPEAVSPEREPGIFLVPAGKIRCYVHADVFRADTPEEHVRQRVSRSLVEEYGYSKADLELESYKDWQRQPQEGRHCSIPSRS